MKLANYLRRVAVLGAGHLGSILAAQLANAGIEVWLYELPTADADTLSQRIQRLCDTAPAVLATPGRGGLIRPMGLGIDLEYLRQCDLVIEAVAEDFDIKTGWLIRVAPFLGDQAILLTSTSGLSVNALARVLPEALRWRYGGLHLAFPGVNPDLVELVASGITDPRVLDRLETLLVQDLGKQVIRVADQPYFIAARFMLVSTLLAIHHGEQWGLGADQVDTLCGSALGRPTRGSFGLVDQLGLTHVISWLDTAREQLPDDPWLATLTFPAWLVERAAQGQPMYPTDSPDTVWDPLQRDYRPVDRQLPEALQAALALPEPAQRWAAIRAEDSPQAQFLWALQRDLYHYAAHWLGALAPSARELDLALRWGLDWPEGLLETWQRSGWRRTSGWISADIRSGNSLVDRPLPTWVSRTRTVHGPQGSLVPGERCPQPRRKLAVYRRQWRPHLLHGETPAPIGEVLWRSGDIALVDGGEGVGIIDLSAAPAGLNSVQVKHLLAVLSQGERCCQALVLWRDGGAFCTGMDEVEVATLWQQGQQRVLLGLQQDWQTCLDRCRDAPLPVVAAVHGDCQGVGAEWLLYCDRVVASFASRFGLRSHGICPVSGAGGFTALARRAYAEAGVGGLALLVRYLPWICQGSLLPNAVAAREVGLLCCADSMVMHPAEVLYVAHQQALCMAVSGYRCTPPQPLPVPGREGLAILQERGFNVLEGSLGLALAEVLVGGHVASGSLLSEARHRQLEASLWQRAWPLPEEASADISPGYPYPPEISFDGLSPRDLA